MARPSRLHPACTRPSQAVIDRRVQKLGCGRWPAGSVDPGRYCHASFIPLRRPLPGAAKTRYLTLCRSLQLLALLANDDAAKELEILVLRHQLKVLRRQTARPRPGPADRALLAAISRGCPDPAGPLFFVRPETLLRWHRRLVAGAWTYPHDQTGRPALDKGVVQLIIGLAKENPRWGHQRIKANSSTWASGHETRSLLTAVASSALTAVASSALTAVASSALTAVASSALRLRRLPLPV
jgi:hypothetical protein